LGSTTAPFFPSVKGFSSMPVKVATPFKTTKVWSSFKCAWSAFSPVPVA